MLKRRQQQPDKGAPKWMITFSDLMTLILVFFIMLFSMSSIDAEKFRTLVESFNHRQNYDHLPSAVEFDHMAPDFEKEEFEEEPVEEVDTEQMDEVLESIQEFISEHELDNDVSAAREDRGVVLTIQERLTFESGEASLLDEAKPFLTQVGSLLEVIPNVIKIEGHTDDRPISTSTYPSNWELSGSRASSVIRYLIDEHNIPADRFISVGYGETQPAVPNTSATNLQTNRRVVIVISDPSYNENDDTF